MSKASAVRRALLRSPKAEQATYELANGRGKMLVAGAPLGHTKEVSFSALPTEQNRRAAADLFAGARSALREDMASRPWYELSPGYHFSARSDDLTPIYDRFVDNFSHPDYVAKKTGPREYELRRKFPTKEALTAAGTAAAAAGAGALAMQPGEAEAAQPVASPALARALARQLPEFNRAVDTSLDVASIFDLSMGYATETARALKDLPSKVGPAGAVALAPLTGATEALAGIGQLPELGVAGGRAIARALARAPQPRGSGTYRKKAK